MKGSEEDPSLSLSSQTSLSQGIKDEREREQILHLDLERISVPEVLFHPKYAPLFLSYYFSLSIFFLS